MEARPGGELCGRMGAVETLSGEERSLAERNAPTRTMGAESAKVGATRTAGEGSRTMQQSGFADLLVCETWEQQLCAVVCVGCRQIPNGARSAPINRMATAARWKNPLRMWAVYHGRSFRV